MDEFTRKKLIKELMSVRKIVLVELVSKVQLKIFLDKHLELCNKLTDYQLILIHEMVHKIYKDHLK